MQTASAEFKRALAKSNPVYKKTIELCRRYWTGTAYVYDTALDVTDQMIECGKIMWKLDREAFGRWTFDNTTIKFRNDRNQWKQDNSAGYFTTTYLLHQTKIRVKVGVQLSDGSYEEIYCFTGYVSDDPIYSPEEKSASVTLISGMSIFEKFIDKDIGYYQGTNELFAWVIGQTVGTTNSNTVGLIQRVIRGATIETATELRPQTDYTVSGLNGHGTPATITLTNAITEGEYAWVTYRNWIEDKPIEYLVRDVLSRCGFGSTGQSYVEDVVFSTDLESTWLQTSQADWEADSLSNIDTASAPGSFSIKALWDLIDDFADGDYTADPVWTVHAGSWSVASGKLKSTIAAGGGLACISTPSTKTTGTWAFAASNSDSKYNACRIWFMANSIGLDGTPDNGYFLEFVDYKVGSTWTTAQGVLYKKVNGVETMLLEGYGAVTHVTRAADGTITVGDHGGAYPNRTVVDTSIQTSSMFCVSTVSTDDAATEQTLDNLYVTTSQDAFYPVVTGLPTLISTINDCGGTVTKYGRFYPLYSANGCTVSFYTYSSSSSDFSTGNDPAGYVAVSSTGGIGSLVQRYLRFKVVLENPLEGAFVTPVVDSILINYYNATTTIQVANYTGMNALQVLETFSKLSCSEMGFTGSGMFVFRSRTTSAPSVLDITESEIRAVSNITSGIERLYNVVEAVIGNYSVLVQDAAAAPNTINKYGARKYNVNETNLLPGAEVNLAYSVAPTILAYTSVPRKRCSIELRNMPHLELGDIVTVYHAQPEALRQWKWGDSDVRWGQADLEFYDEATETERLLLWGVQMRVEGMELDIENWTTTLDLVEVK
jgi:hypothetical protein